MVKELVLKNACKREPGYFYFLDKKGNLMKAKMHIWNKKKKSASKKKPVKKTAKRTKKKKKK